MKITQRFWFYFLSILFIITLSIGESENLKLRELVKNNEIDQKKSVSETVTGKTKIRFPFRKLEKQPDSDDDDDDNENDEEEDDDDDSDDEKPEFTFSKVHKPSYEVKKRANFKFSKISQIINEHNSDKDDDDDDEDEDKSPSIIQWVKNLFTGKKEKVHEKEEDDDVDEEDDDENDDENAVLDLRDEKSLFNRVFDIVKDFWEIKSKIENEKNQDNDDDDDDDDENDEKNEKSDDDDDNDDKRNIEKSEKNKLTVSIKEIFLSVFNRSPINIIFNFDDTDEASFAEDSEEDDKKYQQLLKEEHDQMKRKIDKLSSAEEIVSSADLDENEEGAEKPFSRVGKPKKSKDEYLSQKEFEKLLLNLPSFVPDYSKVKNLECVRQGEVFQRQLRGKRLWALQMMDSTAKIPSGLLRGNTNQLGDFDLCTKISQKIRISESNTMKLKGKYCLANIDIGTSIQELKLPIHLIQGRNFVRSTINDVSSHVIFNDGNHVKISNFFSLIISSLVIRL